MTYEFYWEGDKWVVWHKVLHGEWTVEFNTREDAIEFLKQIILEVQK
jgi:hypothetical protein